MCPIMTRALFFILGPECVLTGCGAQSTANSNDDAGQTSPARDDSGETTSPDGEMSGQESAPFACTVDP